MGLKPSFFGIFDFQCFIAVDEYEKQVKKFGFFYHANLLLKGFTQNSFLPIADQKKDFE